MHSTSSLSPYILIAGAVSHCRSVKDLPLAHTQLDIKAK